MGPISTLTGAFQRDCALAFHLTATIQKGSNSCEASSGIEAKPGSRVSSSAIVQRHTPPVYTRAGYHQNSLK